MFYAGGEYDLCFGAAELLEFVDEVVQFHGGTEGYFDEHGVIAGDAVAFDDVGDGLDEGVEVFFLVGFYFQVNECFYMITEKNRVDLGVVACDQPVFFEVFDPGGDSWGGEENFLCDFLYRGAGVFLKHFDDLSVNIVKLVFHADWLLSMVFLYGLYCVCYHNTRNDLIKIRKTNTILKKINLNYWKTRIIVVFP